MNCSERFLVGRLCSAFPAILRKPKNLSETNKPSMLKKESKVTKNQNGADRITSTGRKLP